MTCRALCCFRTCDLVDLPARTWDCRLTKSAMWSAAAVFRSAEPLILPAGGGSRFHWVSMIEPSPQKWRAQGKARGYCHSE